MRRRRAVAAALALAVAGLGAAPAAAAPAPPALESLPLAFERAAGSAGARAQFVARGAHGTLLLRAGDATLVPAARAGGGGTLRMRLAGADRGAAARGARRQAGGTNHLVGDDPARWRRGVPTYGEVRYHRVYPGVDVRYHGADGRLEYDFELAPGADPDVIAIDLLGARRARIGADGDLNVTLAPRRGVVQRAPRIYQDVGGRRRSVRGRFVLHGARRVGFALGAYDRTRPLVIDPEVVVATTLGGSGSEAGRAIATDADGATFVTGETTSADFPVPAGGVRRARTAAFVTKLDAGGRRVYTTILGGAGVSGGRGIAVDAAGRAYVTGATNATDFPTTPGALQRSYGGGPVDAFVAVLDPTGRQLVYSTLLGDTHYDEANAIAVDRAGRAVIAGKTASPQFPLAGGLQRPVAGGAFVAKLDRRGASLVFSTVFGGNDRGDHGNTAFGVAVDPAGATYAAGVTNRPTFPTRAPLQPALAGGGDAFVVKIDPAGWRVAYSTYLGGSADDSARAIAADGAGNAYVTGVTSSPDFPRQGAQLAAGGGADAFVTKLDRRGRRLTYATRLGGRDDDEASAIAVDAAGGGAAVTGRTRSPDFPVTAPGAASGAAPGTAPPEVTPGTAPEGTPGAAPGTAPEATPGTAPEGTPETSPGAAPGTTPGAVTPGGAFVTRLARDGASLAFSTRLGDDASPSGLGIALDRFGALAVTGQAGPARGGQAFVRVLAPSARVQLRRQLVPRGATARIGRLLRRGGADLRFVAPRAGLVRIAWYSGPSRIAAGQARFRAAGARTVSVRLSPAGRRRLALALARTPTQRTTLTARGAFLPNGSAPVRTQTSFVLLR